MAWRIDDHQTRHAHVNLFLLDERSHAINQRLLREEGGANLLRDATGLAILHVGAPDVVEQLRLAGIDVAHDTHDARTQPIRRTRRLGILRALLACRPCQGLTLDQLVVLGVRIRVVIVIVIVRIVVVVLLLRLEVSELVEGLLLALLRRRLLRGRRRRQLSQP